MILVMSDCYFAGFYYELVCGVAVITSALNAGDRG